MYSKVYEFAGIVVRINSVYEYIHKMSEKYVSSKDEVFSITISEEDINNENEKSTIVNNEVSFPPSYLETLAVYRKFLDYAIKENVFLFHSSSFKIDEGGFIITAPSGTGKSTHARYLKEVYKDRFTVINDDKPLIKMVNNEFYVYGSPWNGKHGLDNNICVKLKGIFTIYQSKVNEIRKMDSSSAFNAIYKQVHKPLGKEKMGSVLSMIIKMANSIPTYTFGCTNSIVSTDVSKEVIDELNKE